MILVSEGAADLFYCSQKLKGRRDFVPRPCVMPRLFIDKTRLIEIHRENLRLK